MFNLIVSGHVADTGATQLAMDRERFLESTAASISRQLKTLSIEAVESLKSWPCLLMQEGRSNELAFVAYLTGIKGEGRSNISITTQEIICLPGLNNKALWELRSELDIDEFEFHRNHWAIKERDLIGSLVAAGFKLESQYQTIARPLPSPNREAILRVKSLVSEWSHTAIDDFLLEAGIQIEKAGRDGGSRRDRANAIIQFILANPSEVTAENHLLSTFLVSKAEGTSASSLASPSPLPVMTIAEAALTQGTNGPDDRSPNRVFVVHGRNDDVRDQVVAALESVALEPLVLHEQPNMGRHLLTKFIEEAKLVTFAVVIMTDDDLGGPRDGELRARARQNVILELGYFLSHLGQKRVCALVSPDLETPSDFDGIVYIKMSSDGRWRTELLRELSAAKMPVKKMT